MSQTPAPRLGIALGSGSARGWAHLGVLGALSKAGIEPQIVAGTSIGALVGAAYASGRLDALRDWIVGLDWWEMLRLMDIRAGGLIEGERLMKAYAERVPDAPIDTLARRFGAVATDLYTGREVWLTSGSLVASVRASIAMPGLFSPVHQEDHWLVDGGLVNPVPVSLCRALGADRVIAVNLNGDLRGRRFLRRSKRTRVTGLLDLWTRRLQGMAGETRRAGAGSISADAPSLFDVMAGAMHIMQDRITRSRLAGDPADVVLSPRLGHVALLDFDAAEETMVAGEACVELYASVLHDGLGLGSDD